MSFLFLITQACTFACSFNLLQPWIEILALDMQTRTEDTKLKADTSVPIFVA